MLNTLLSCLFIIFSIPSCHFSFFFFFPPLFLTQCLKRFSALLFWHRKAFLPPQNRGHWLLSGMRLIFILFLHSFWVCIHRTLLRFEFDIYLHEVIKAMYKSVLRYGSEKALGYTTGGIGEMDLRLLLTVVPDTHLNTVEVIHLS